MRRFHLAHAPGLILLIGFLAPSARSREVHALPEPQQSCPSPKGLAAIQQRALDEALRFFEKTWLESNRQLKECQCQLGAIKANQGRIKEAKESLRECMQPPYDHLSAAEVAAYQAFIDRPDPVPRYRQPWIWILLSTGLAAALSIGIGVSIHNTQDTTIINFPQSRN